MRTDELDFHLPADLIAQEPATQRSASRLLHYRRSDRSVTHLTFEGLADLLPSGDLLVLNDSKVIPARFLLRKQTGGLVEGLFLTQPGANRWRVRLKNLGQYNSRKLTFVEGQSLTAKVVRFDDGEYEIEVDTTEPAPDVLGRIGRMPLPPYIKRDKQHDSRDATDRHRYQTVFARTDGSVAAPTAGLHFTDAVFESLLQRGADWCFVTLHVGLGTFKPVTATTLAQHVMHAESYSISADAAAKLNHAKREQRRIIAVGTTAARVLESQPDQQPFEPRTDSTSIFIFPPYRWKHIGALITNFHLPRSTLIALVAAFVGLDEQRRIYQIAIDNKYRFFSYGDAMFIE